MSTNSATRPPDICSYETSGLQFFRIESWQAYNVGQATGTQRTDNGGLIVHLSYHRCFLTQPATLPQSHQQHLFRFASLHFSPNLSGHLSQVQGLVTLLYGYIPALFIIGSQVRDCHWSAHGEQHPAGPLLSRCLHVLLRLTLGYEDKIEYVRTIVVARLLWSQWFARLPGVAHSEEPCEALLSRVVHLMAQHPGNCTLQQVDDLFILTPVADQAPKDIQYVNVPKGPPQLVDRRFTRLMARFDVGVTPP